MSVHDNTSCFGSRLVFELDELKDWAFVESAIVCENGGDFEASISRLNYRINKALNEKSDVVVEAQGKDRPIHLKIRAPFKVSAPMVQGIPYGGGYPVCVTLTKS